MKNRLKNFASLVCSCLLVLLTGLVSSCKDDDGPAEVPFDASKPVVVSDFSPKEGGYQDQLLIYGQNFGNDREALTVTIGGKKAVVVSVRNDLIYCYVPSGAFTGEIVVTVTNDGHDYSGEAATRFAYARKTVVGTLCGYQNENDSQGENIGSAANPVSFADVAGFNAEGCMAFDPLYPNRLYIVYDRGDGFIQQLDLANRTSQRLMSSSKFQNTRLRNIDFTLDGKYMLVSADRDDNSRHSTSVWIVARNANGTFSDASNTQVLAAYRQCNGVAVHPVDGDIYFNSYENGQLFRLSKDSLDSYLSRQTGGYSENNWTGYLEDKCFEELFKIQDPSYEFQVTIHPTGKYAYLTVINRNYILRTDYDETTHRFTTPYVIAGLNGTGAWVDAVGTNARVNRPYQGVFVKNPQYEAEGRDDVYDYYFCDCLNFCVRYVTPDGLMRTYAGRAPATNGNIWGTEDGDLRQAARFRDVTGIAYDKARETFYVLDHNNRRIRYIGKEEEE